jgi:hypothetical protein
LTDKEAVAPIRLVVARLQAKFPRQARPRRESTEQLNLAGQVLWFPSHGWHAQALDVSKPSKKAQKKQGRVAEGEESGNTRRLYLALPYYRHDK